MTYWETFYGTCKIKPNGSPDCCAHCKKCMGTNWKPLGCKSFEELRAHFMMATTPLVPGAAINRRTR